MPEKEKATDTQKFKVSDTVRVYETGRKRRVRFTGRVTNILNIASGQLLEVVWEDMPFLVGARCCRIKK